MKYGLLLLLLVAFDYHIATSQVTAVGRKGTIVTFDSSKWKLSGVDIYNKNSGNVGIGTASPVYKLDITGKLRVTDSLVSNSARILNLLSGSVSDSLVVADPTTGVLKRISTQLLNQVDSTSAANGLTLSGKQVQLGGSLTLPTSITASGANSLTIATSGSSLNISGLSAGALTDSLLTINNTTGKVNRINVASLNHVDSTTASNGLSLSSKDVRLGGTLNAATTITTSATNTLALTGLSSGALTDSLLVVSTGGVIKKIVALQVFPQLLVEAKRTTTYTTTAAFATLIYNTAATNVGTAYNISTGIFTAPASGLYEVMFANEYLWALAGNCQLVNQISVNGTVDQEIAISNYPTVTNTATSAIGSTFVNLTAGQTITILVGGLIGTVTPVVGTGQHSLKIIRLN